MADCNADPVDFLKSRLLPMQGKLTASTTGVNHAAQLLKALDFVEQRAQAQLNAVDQSFRKAVADAGREASNAWTRHATLNNEHATMLVEALDLSRAIEQQRSSVEQAAFQRRLTALQVQISAHEQAMARVAQQANKALQQVAFNAKAMLANPKRQQILAERDSQQTTLLKVHEARHKHMQRDAKRYARRLREFVRQNDEMGRTMRTRAHPSDSESAGENADADESADESESDSYEE